MNGTKVVFLATTLGVFVQAAVGRTFVGIVFEQLAAPSGCIRNTTVPTSSPAIPPLKLPGVVISGGQVLSYANPFQTTNNVYFTLNTCAGVQPTMTLTFDGPASNVT